MVGLKHLYCASIFFSVLPGSDVNVVLLRLLFLRAFALPQVFAKAHQQTSYYTEREREAGQGVACRDTKEKGNRLGHLLHRNKCLWENLTWQAAILAEQAFRRNYSKIGLLPWVFLMPIWQERRILSMLIFKIWCFYMGLHEAETFSCPFSSPPAHITLVCLTD